MLKWLGLLASIAAVPMMYGVGPRWGLWLALVALGASFTTFCLLYDQPLNRARLRVTEQLGRLSSRGVTSEDYYRLQATAIKPTAEDRRMSLTPMLAVNILGGIIGLGLAIWGAALRLT